ncbi:DUF7359 domain-containing protein [Novosphingobium album (ex Liu et al. 2023)]|uniref:DUF7359 domain-containing protein n=1 Tax=Novosphingobium album (ex Liu et al. 2023) TaxID=3031130 RepID=A0ABT5WXZ1_9SPHN|nr:hypothetical protein [Novosphingobium album (ex Liu et al. 2023)]MDE8654772.1 hypothetical protein [Novosphingobium album (ex Liu et al. 2023)]
MSKTLRTIGMIVGAVALVATGVGAVAGGTIIGATVGAAGSVAVTLGSVTSTIATIAGIAAGAAQIGAQLLYKPPPARGGVTQILIAPDAPQPYVMGEGYFAGVLRHDCGYGADLKKVPNPYRFLPCVYSGGGPIESITPWVDQGPVSSWYSGFLYTDTQLGATPEANALAPQFAGAPGWTSASKLSGQAAIGWSLKFDKDGKRFASGLPQFGAHGKWVKVYDPRKDSTYPGGSGSHRLGDESTYEWSENPALHSGTYAYGRFQNGKRVLGMGLPATAIDWPSVVAWANVCDANGWTIFGVVFEPMPDTRWPNLKDIAAAGGGLPIIANGLLSFKYSAPRVVLDTFTEADLASSDANVTAMTSRRQRINTIVPKYRSAEHNWELIGAIDPVSAEIYVTEDGEERKAEWPFNLVKDKDQAAQLAAYVIADAREMQPITATFGVRVRHYRPGDCVHLTIPSLALDHDVVILTREFDAAQLTTTFTFMSETAAKHDWALGRTTIAPPTPGLKQTGQERDEQAAAAAKPYGWQLAIIRTASINNPRDASDVSSYLLTATTTDPGGVSTIVVARHDWDYPDGTEDVTRETGTITGLAPATLYHVYFDDPDLTDTAPTYHATTDPAEGLNSSDYPDRHPLGRITTPAIGAGPTHGGVPPGYGYGPLTELPSDFNSFNNRNGAAIPTPSTPTDGTCVDHSLNDNGSADISFEWIWGGSEASIDGFEVLLFSGDTNVAHNPGTLPGLETVYIVPANKRAWIIQGVQPTNYYTFAVRAYRDVDPDIDASGKIYSSWKKSTVAGENPYRPSANTAVAAAVLINGTSAANVASAVGNFNNRNDRLATTPPTCTFAADGTCIDHTINGNGTADISFEWIWSGTEADIDYFEVMIYPSASSGAYTPGATPALEQRSTHLPGTRALIVQGVSPTRYYTFAVRAVRVVDRDVAAAGMIAGAWAKSTVAGENPYRPSSSIAFTGDITGTINGTTAANVATWSGYAQLAINSDGTIKDGLVGEGAIIPGAINLAGYAMEGTTHELTSDGETTASSAFAAGAIAVPAAGVITLNVSAVIPYEIIVEDPVQDGEYSLTLTMVLYRNTGSGWGSGLYETAPIIVSDVWQAADAAGFKSLGRKTHKIEFQFSIYSLPAQWALGWRVTAGPNNRGNLYQRWFKIDNPRALQ